MENIYNDAFVRYGKERSPMFLRCMEEERKKVIIGHSAS
jgi:hypothetical protein